ncbi:hypothetical protein QTJ16_003520 [Diplocarpon rosae]|uniref:Uncharacterized protein n=1 Tax=Diplocarpon rosae TaxID=946125 RepID=A0AAD9T2I3_9HELO|nr:hypothetical protein QTJ16_003520 [Diplocarpon rosae]
MAYSMLCRKDEMVMDMDFFLDTSAHWSNPSLSSEQSQANTVDSTSPAMSSLIDCNGDSDCIASTFLPQQSHINTFYNYKHAGCNHRYSSEENAHVASGLQLWESAKNVLSSLERSTVYLINPRWHNYEVHMRQQHINAIARSQCATIASSTKANDVKAVLKQYALGITRNRKEALTLPLRECENIYRPAEERLVDLLKGFRVSTIVKERGELAEMMEMMVLDFDQLRQDFAQVFKELDAHEKGISYDRAYQARREQGGVQRGVGRGVHKAAFESLLTTIRTESSVCYHRGVFDGRQDLLVNL